MGERLYIFFISSNCSNHFMGIGVVPRRRPFVGPGKDTSLLG